MHICFLTSEYPKEGFPHGGVGTFVKTIARSLVERGLQVSVIGLNYEDAYQEIVSDDVLIVRLPPSKIKGLAWYFNSKAIAKAISNVHKKNPIDIVEGAELSFAFIPKLKAIKYLIRLHGGHHFFAEAENRGINWWKGFQEKRSFKKADAFIAVSEYVKKQTATFLKYNEKPVEVIFNPIDINHFMPQDGPEESNNITFAGTLCEKKGVRQLIQAFPYIKEKFPNAILNLYGRDWRFQNGTSYVKMLQEVELPKLGYIAKDIIFHGSVSNHEIPSVYAKAAICVFPSHMETLGLVAPEAMAMEKAVVFTNLGPGPEVITHGDTGLLCNPHSPQDIAKQILYFLDNEKQRVIFGKKARLSVLEKFNTLRVADENILFYDKLTPKSLNN